MVLLAPASAGGGAAAADGRTASGGRWGRPAGRRAANMSLEPPQRGGSSRDLRIQGVFRSVDLLSLFGVSSIILEVTFRGWCLMSHRLQGCRGCTCCSTSLPHSVRIGIFRRADRVGYFWGNNLWHLTRSEELSYSRLWALYFWDLVNARS